MASAPGHEARGLLDAHQAIKAATFELESAAIPEPAASAEILLAELLDIGRVDLTLRNPVLTNEQQKVYRAWISRRKSREPVQRILGYSYFRNLKLRLNEETLIPRPETESVVEIALRYVSRDRAFRVLDIGTGSGAISISIAQERLGCEVHATDSSKSALQLAAENAAGAGVSVDFHLADLVSGLDELRGSFDLLVSNPPYVKTGDIQGLPSEVREWDPAVALDGGADGLEFYRRIFAETSYLLKRGGYFVMEVGDGQAKEVLDLGNRAGFAPLGTYPDLTGRARAVVLGMERVK